MIFRRIGKRPIKDLKIMGKLFPAADAAARADGVETAGAEYLLLAALDLDDGSGRRAFDRVGVDPDAFHDAIRAQHTDALAAVGVTGLDDSALDDYLPEPEPESSPRPLNGAPSAHRMFRSVADKVQQDRSQLYSAYFVLIAAQTEHGTTIRAIRHMGIEPGDLAAAAQREIDALVRAG